MLRPCRQPLIFGVLGGPAGNQRRKGEQYPMILFTLIQRAKEMDRVFRQAAANTFCLIPSFFNAVTVKSDCIVSHSSYGQSHVLPINSTTRMSTSGWGYVCVDVNSGNPTEKFQEFVYPRVMDTDGFMQAIREAIDNQSN